MSVCIGASAAGARTYTATASQGLLYMAEALYNASGLGLPIVMTVANRAIGAPINIWNDHSRLDVAARLRLDPALRRDQPGGARPAHPGVPARRGALAAGDGLHGRLHPHARVRAGRHARRRSRSTPSCRRSSRARCSTPTTPVTIGAMVGPEAFTEVTLPRCTPSRCRRSTRSPRSPPTSRRRSGARPAGSCAATAPRTPRPSSSRSARCSARSRTSSTSCASEGERVGALGITLLPAVAARRGARGARRTRRASSCSRRRSPSASAASSARTCGWRSTGLELRVHDVDRRARRAADHAGVAARAARGRARRPARRADLPRHRLGAGRARARSAATPGRTRRTCCATSARDAGGLTCRFYQVGAFAVGNRLLRPRSARCRPTRSARTRSPRATAPARAAARRSARATRSTPRCARPSGRLVAANATGCLEVFSTPYPETSWQHPVAALAVRQRAGGRHRHRRRAEGQGPRRRPRRRPGRRRRHRRHRLRLPVGDVRAQRRRALHLLRQRGLHEHRRAALRRDAAGRAHRDHRRRSGAEPGNVFGQGKSAPLIAMAHEIPYVATATVADLRDLEAKVERAMELRGARYLHVLVPCPLGWGSASRRHDPDRAAGRRRPACSRCSRPTTARSRRSRRSAARCRSRSTCARSGASRTCSSRAARRTSSRAIQARADRNIARFGLPCMMDKPFAITLDVGSSLANKTGSWRTERPRLRPPAAAVQRRLPGRRGHRRPGSTTPRRATTRPPGARSWTTTRCPP